MLLNLGLIPGFVTADEMTRITLVGSVSGLWGGVMSVILEECLKPKSERQNLEKTTIVKKSLFGGCTQAIILGIVAFAMAAWNLEQTELEIDRFSMIMGITFALTPLGTVLFNKLTWNRSSDGRD